MLLIRLPLIILSPKVSQDLTFIRRISGGVDETGSRFYLRVIYISFSVLAGDLSCRRASFRRGGFSSHIPSVTSTVGICLGRFFIRRLYYTFVNIFCNFHTLKHINSLFKRNGFAIKALNIGLFRTSIRHAV